MNIINWLSEMYSTQWGEMLILCALWAFWPGLMFVVGAIFESRLVPVGPGQSLAFMPGNMTLMCVIWKLGKMYVETLPLMTWGKSPLWWAVVALVALVIAGLLRIMDGGSYAPRARNSPTKWTHDVVGYFGITFLIIGMIMPELQLIATSLALRVAMRNEWMLIVIWVMLYILCMVIDDMHPASALNIQMRHPEDWKPIWQRNPKK